MRIVLSLVLWLEPDFKLDPSFNLSKFLKSMAIRADDIASLLHFFLSLHPSTLFKSTRSCLLKINSNYLYRQSDLRMNRRIPSTACGRLMLTYLAYMKDSGSSLQFDQRKPAAVSSQDMSSYASPSLFKWSKEELEPAHRIQLPHSIDAQMLLFPRA